MCCFKMSLWWFQHRCNNSFTRMLIMTPKKQSQLPVSFVGFDFTCSFLATGASVSHSLASDILRLVFDLVGLVFSTGGGNLSALLAASWACNAAACHAQQNYIKLSIVHNVTVTYVLYTELTISLLAASVTHFAYLQSVEMGWVAWSNTKMAHLLSPISVLTWLNYRSHLPEPTANMCVNFNIREVTKLMQPMMLPLHKATIDQLEPS